MTLERLLQAQGFGTRKECRALVRMGRVQVGGHTCTDPFAEFDPAGLRFSVDGEPWDYRDKVYLALNKPAGYECSRRPLHHPSVFGLLPEPLIRRGVQPVGRLDEDSTGLLLFSDDGQFIHALTSPRRHIAKVYEVRTKHPVSDALVSALLAGVQLRDDPAPVAATACAQTGEHALRLTLTGGRYHQVKRMIAAAGNRVEALHRVAVGSYALPDWLPPKGWVWIEASQVLEPRSA
jgi:16S rRNA pseudouridine516 synthase